MYRLALPEGIARGAFGISRALAVILKNPKNTGVPIWSATEQEIKRRGGLVRRQELRSFQIVNPGGIR
mgnify:FL=1